MDCNKDEALRAKQIAESRMQCGDFVGALKFAMKAKKLFPEIENIAQILTVCEVHCAAQNKLHGTDKDWYGILQTERSADEATIKKQYRKLALLLHPDKNKSAGAEAAFKLIGEANGVLSDQTKRSTYDMNRRVPVRTTAPKPSSHHSNGSSFGVKNDGNARNYQNNFYSRPPSWNSCQWDEQQTFWTSCQHCNTRYQYYKTIVNATLRCQQCSKSFTARDLGYQGVPPGYTWTSFNNQKEAPKNVPPKAASESNGGRPCGRGQEDKFVRSYPESMTKCTAGIGGRSKVENSKDGHAAAGGTKAGVGISKPAASKAKESQTSTNVGSKRARQSASDSREDNNAGNGNDMKDTNVRENGVDPSGHKAGVHPRRSSRKKQNVSYTETSQGVDFESSFKRPRQYESFNTTEVEKREKPESGGLFNNNNPASFTAVVGGQNGELKNKPSDPPEETLSRNKTKIEQSHERKASKSDLEDRKSKADNCSPLNSNSPTNPETFICPDPDFSDFEKDKAEDCFAANQFWAIYDNFDSMPRYYALVKKVFSPFKLQITWLEADPDDQGEIDWHDAGLPVACGKYRLGDSQRTIDRGMFSHQMQSMKRSGRGSYLVYPKKGETWAIFRDWDIGWSSKTERHLELQFEYVEVLSDFDENVGIKVAYLVKVKGFVSLFWRTVQNGVSLFCVPPNELYRFSHQIPSYKMTGDEREGVPRGSFELDPAALPTKLLEVGDVNVKIEDGVLNNVVNCSRPESTKCKVEQAISDESVHKAKLHESNDAERVSSILRRSPRSNRKIMDNGQVSTSQCMVREDDKDIGHRDCCQPEGIAAACQASEAKTPQKHEKINYERETLKVRKSPRDLSGKNAQEDAGECTTGKVTDNHSNANKNVTDSSFSQSVGSVRNSLKKDCRVVGASCYDFKKEKSEARFQCDQIWAIYGERDKVPDVYAQIKKVEFTPNFRLHVSLLEPSSPSIGLKRTISCGTFKVKKAKSQILSLSAFSHQLKVEPMANSVYEIYPRKGEIWALYKDKNYELISSNGGRGECHIVEVLADSDKSIQVVVLIPLSGSQPIFRAPRIQRSKTGIIEILREEIGRFSHQIPAFQYTGEVDAHLRGCWLLDPSSIPGFVKQLD